MRSRAGLFELIGKEGDDLLAQMVDPGAIKNDDLTIYRHADTWAPVLEKALSIGVTELVRRTGLAERTARYVIEGRRPSPETAALVAESLSEIVAIPPRICGRAGCDARVAGRQAILFGPLPQSDSPCQGSPEVARGWCVSLSLWRCSLRRSQGCLPRMRWTDEGRGLDSNLSRMRCATTRDCRCPVSRMRWCSMTIDELIERFRRWLYLPDPAPLIMTLAAYVANRLPGDPVWLLLVGPPSSGKTELLNAFSGLDDAFSVSTFTEAGLLSGSSGRRANATGGLLAELKSFGVIVCKDFGSVLSGSSEARAVILAALRGIYDGSWCRRLGTGGGLTLAWSGKAGLLAGVTETIDRHTATIGALGERFLFYRMPALNDEGRLEQGRRAAANTGQQVTMRKELAAAVTDFLAGLSIPQTAQPIPGAMTENLVRLADLATRCRSPVERDSRDREVELVPQPEAVGRLQAVLVQLMRGAWTIGMSDDDVGPLLRGSSPRLHSKDSSTGNRTPGIPWPDGLLVDA